jgi:glycosyltransferase involved in cell wall biosynthesis
LPLIEAAYFGLPILVSDLDYARELLHEYKGATFVQYDNVVKWANAIIELSKTHQKVDSFKVYSINNSMSKFLELSNEIINNNVQK